MIPSRALGVLAAVALLGFAALVILSETRLAYGEGLLDGRIAGYDLDDVHAYLAVLPAEARAFYVGPFRLLDTIVPPLIALALGGVIWSSTRGVLRALVILPLIYVGCDLYENALVGQILKADTLDVETIATASQMTVTKWVFTLASLGVAILTWRKARVMI